jgi:hypothetical protein
MFVTTNFYHHQYKVNQICPLIFEIQSQLIIFFQEKFQEEEEEKESSPNKEKLKVTI